MNILKFTITVFLLFLTFTSYGQNNNYVKSSDISKVYTIQKTNKFGSSWDLANERSKSGDSYHFMALRRDFGFINELILANDLSVIKQGVILLDNIMSSAKSSETLNSKNFHDKYLGWISKNENREYGKEVALYESYSFFYISQFLFLLKDVGWINDSEANYAWWQNAVSFIETNVWKKWIERSVNSKNKRYWYFLRQRTHMGSHWAGVAMYLNNITKEEEIRKETSDVQRQFDLLLKRNFQIVDDCFVWNSTYDNIDGTDASFTKKPIIQDVSHGNHVISYIIAAYNLGSEVWDKSDLIHLANTLKYKVYNTQKNGFSDNVDGSDNQSRPGWGNFIGDGWIKLAQYDSEVESIFSKFGENKELLEKYYQTNQFNSTMFKVKYLKSRNK